MESHRTSNDHATIAEHGSQELPKWISLDDAASVSAVSPAELVKIVRLGAVRTRYARQDPGAADGLAQDRRPREERRVRPTSSTVALHARVRSPGATRRGGACALGQPDDCHRRCSVPGHALRHRLRGSETCWTCSTKRAEHRLQAILRMGKVQAHGLSIAAPGARETSLRAASPRQDLRLPTSRHPQAPVGIPDQAGRVLHRRFASSRGSLCTLGPRREPITGTTITMERTTIVGPATPLDGRAPSTPTNCRPALMSSARRCICIMAGS